MYSPSVEHIICFLNYLASFAALDNDSFTDFSIDSNTDHEPINGAAVDERGEFPQPVPEGIANGAHSQNHMELFTAPLDEEGEERLRGAIRLAGLVSLSVQLPHLLTDLRLLIYGVQVGNFPRIQQVVYVLQERFLFDL